VNRQVYLLLAAHTRERGHEQLLEHVRLDGEALGSELPHMLDAVGHDPLAVPTL
jgi:hypothetical protein